MNYRDSKYNDTVAKNYYHRKYLGNISIYFYVQYE